MGIDVYSSLCDFFIGILPVLHNTALHRIWIGGEYILPKSVFYGILAIFTLNMLRDTTDQFISGYGMYYDSWSPIAESVIFILCSILGDRFFGLSGVLLGSIMSILCVIHVWKPYFLFRDGLNYQ